MLHLISFLKHVNNTLRGYGHIYVIWVRGWESPIQCHCHLQERDWRMWLRWIWGESSEMFYFFKETWSKDSKIFRFISKLDSVTCIFRVSFTMLFWIFFQNAFTQAKEKDFKHFDSVIYINASENLLPLGELFLPESCLLPLGQHSQSLMLEPACQPIRDWPRISFWSAVSWALESTQAWILTHSEHHLLRTFLCELLRPLSVNGDNPLAFFLPKVRCLVDSEEMGIYRCKNSYWSIKPSCLFSKPTATPAGWQDYVNTWLLEMNASRSCSDES